MNPETLRDFFRERSWTIQMPYDNAQPDDPFPLVVDAVKHAVLADAIQRVEGLTSWPRVSWWAYEPKGGNVTEDRVVIDRDAVLSILRDLGDGADGHER